MKITATVVLYDDIGDYELTVLVPDFELLARFIAHTEATLKTYKKADEK